MIRASLLYSRLHHLSVGKKTLSSPELLIFQGTPLRQSPNQYELIPHVNSTFHVSTNPLPCLIPYLLANFEAFCCIFLPQESKRNTNAAATLNHFRGMRGTQKTTTPSLLPKVEFHKSSVPFLLEKIKKERQCHH